MNTVYGGMEEYNCSDMSQYGLAEPAATVRVHYTEEQTVEDSEDTSDSGESSDSSASSDSGILLLPPAVLQSLRKRLRLQWKKIWCFWWEIRMKREIIM